MIYKKIKYLKAVTRFGGLLLFISIIALQNIDAQNLNDVEKGFESLKSNLVKENFILDSLNQSLEERAELINEEKGKSKPDQDKIYKLMAGSVTISNSIELQQKIISQLEKTLEETSQKLDYNYTVLIDSLKALKQTTLKMSDVRDIDRQILSNIEKRLLITPRINQLSFIPEKILAINLTKTKDTVQRNIYAEYLTSALNEVNTLLSQVNETSSEITQIIALHTKANKFLDEVEFENRIKPVGTSSTMSASTEASIRFSDEKGSEFSSQLQSYVSLNDQLNFRQSPYIHTTGEKSLKFSNDRVSLKDYLELLKELKKGLSDYRSILSEKLNARR
ncbi:MAG: hypothetical protein QME58_03165 [Bacteroidota bacterium]|nr:hypothetical protein [Bacteroidota bacterium]